MFKNTIKGLMEDYKGFKYKMDEVMPVVKVMRAKLENKAYEVYFKSFREYQKNHKLTSSDYNTYYQASVDFTKNLAIIRNGGK